MSPFPLHGVGTIWTPQIPDQLLGVSEIVLLEPLWFVKTT